MSRAAKSPLPKAAPPNPPRWHEWLLLTLSVLIIIVLIILPSMWSTSATSLSYTDFLTKVDSGQVVSVTIDDHGSVSGSFRDKGAFTSQIPTALNNVRLEGAAAEEPLMVSG